MTNTKASTSKRKILVVYYSLSGNTARVAHDIAARTGADMESIRGPGLRPGFLGFLKGGIDSMRGVKAKIGPIAKNPGDYALTIIGTPVWAGNMSTAMRAYLHQTQGRLGRVAFFVTSGKTDVAKILPPLEALGQTTAVAALGFNKRELKDPKIYEEKLAAFLKDIHLQDTSLEVSIAPRAYAM